jgi:drug/metabolite transporter (DMT)-like permease
MFLLAIEAGAAPVPVTIVAHTWPVWMALIVLIAGVARGTIWDLFAFGLGFAGVLTVATREGSFEFHVGLGIALLGAVLWAIYSGLRTRVPAGPPDAMTAFAIVSAVVSWTLHVALGESSGVAPLDLAIAIAVGALPMGLANSFWDIAVRRGDPVLIAGMSFIEPVFATGFVLLLLAQAPQPMDILALVLVLAGLTFGTISERIRRNRGARAIAAKPMTGPAGVEDVGTDQPPAGSTQQD